MLEICLKAEIKPTRLVYTKIISSFFHETLGMKHFS